MFDKDFDTKQDLTDDTADDGDHARVNALPVLTPVASTPVDLAQIGLAELAYIRPGVINDVAIWSIYSAAGHPLGAAPSFEQAWAAVKQNDLEPVRVH